MRLPPATYMIVVLGIQCWAECDTQPSVLKIAIHDYTGVRPSVLERSKREATRILGDMGYGLTWVHCASDEDLCRQPATPTILVLRVLPENNRTSEKDALASAILPAAGFGSYFVVFYGRVKQMTKVESSEGVLLGHAIAHELGHLLLGSNAHSRDGIMAGRWSPRELARIAKRSLTFSEEQRVRMRKNVSGRLLAVGSETCTTRRTDQLARR